MIERDAAQPLARVGLCLAAESRRGFTGAPAQVTIGSVDFGGWQIHPVATAPGDFPASAAYLVKINYDVGFSAGSPAPTWVDAGFEFLDEGVAVADALPRSVRQATAARRYSLTPHLAFDAAGDVVRSGSALGLAVHESIPMPPLTPVLEVFGIGGPLIRWRHTAAAGAAGPAGSQVRWLALLVPAGCRELHVRARGGYGSTPHRLRGRQASATPDTFTVRLPAPAPGPAPDTERPPGTGAPAAAGVTAGGSAGSGLADGAGPHVHTAPAALSVRMGFVVDVVGYSQRTEPGQYAVQRRLAALIHDVMGDIGIALDENYAQPTGDGMNVFLPPATDISRALPVLLESTATRLGRDNQQHTDRVRLRMATDIGPVRPAAAGFSGNTIISFGRLADSTPIRDAISEQPGADLAVLVSGWLYESVVSQGYAGLDRTRFTRVHAMVKGFQADAWLWTSGPRSI